MYVSKPLFSSSCGVEPLLILLLCLFFCGRNPRGDPALSSLGYLFLIFESKPLLNSSCRFEWSHCSFTSSALVGVIQAETQLFLSWVTYFLFSVAHLRGALPWLLLLSLLVFSPLLKIALFLVWVVKLSSRSSFSLNCSEMHHVHTLTSKIIRNSLNNLFIFNKPKYENYNQFS